MAKRLDRDADGDWTDAETSVWYRATDTLFSVVAMIDSGGDMYERVEYDAYGNAQHRYYGDVNGDGVFTTSDLFTANGASGITSTKYHADIDTDFDGTYQTDEITAYSSAPSTALPDGWISDPTSTDGPDNSIGYAGYVFNHEREDYTVRFRNYNPQLGRWMQRDPIGYFDGSNMYVYVDSNSLRYIDPLGLRYVDTGEDTSSYIPESGIMHYEVPNPQGGIGNSNSGYRYKRASRVDWDCVSCDPDVIAAEKALDAAKGNPTPSNPFDDGGAAYSLSSSLYTDATLETGAAGYAKVTGDAFTKKFGGAMAGGIMTGAEMLAVGQEGDMYDVAQTGISGGVATGVGFLAGAKAGSALGSFGGPAGAIGGFVVGGLASWATDSVIDIATQNSKQVRDAKKNYHDALKAAVEKYRQ